MMATDPAAENFRRFESTPTGSADFPAAS